MSIFGEPNIEKMEERHDIKGLIRVINKEKKDETRIKAILALSKFKDEQTVEPLISIIKNERINDIKINAVKALGLIGGATSKKVLCEELEKSLDQKELNYFTIIAKILSELGDQSVINELEMAFIRSTCRILDEDYRETASIALSKNSEQALEFFINGLDYDFADVRGASAWAFGHLGEKAISPLITLFTDPKINPRKRWGVVVALWRIGNAAIEPLKKIFIEKGITDALRWSVYRALVLIVVYTFFCKS